MKKCDPKIDHSGSLVTSYKAGCKGTKCVDFNAARSRAWRNKNSVSHGAHGLQVSGNDGIQDTEVTLTLEEWQDANNYNPRRRRYGD